jgi:uncharacterized YigZ family protein
MIPPATDEYFTIKGKVRSKTKVEGSVFIATVVPVDSEEVAEDWIKKICKEFFDATHNCYAWRIKKGDQESSKFSDAGEPRGTAGRPILAAIQSEDLSDVLVMVTRYFGGIKLGTGGLSRAYRLSAQGVLQKAERVSRLITSEITLSYPLNMTGKVNQVFGKYSVRVKGQEFEDKPTATIQVRRSQLKKVKEALVEATNGKIEFR